MQTLARSEYRATIDLKGQDMEQKKTIEQLLAMPPKERVEYLQQLPEQEAKQVKRELLQAQADLDAKKMVDNLNSNKPPSLSQALKSAQQKDWKLTGVRFPPADKKPDEPK